MNAEASGPEPLASVAIPLILDAMTAETLRGALLLALDAVGERSWADMAGSVVPGVTLEWGGSQLALKMSAGTLLFETKDAVIGRTEGPAAVLRSWIGSTFHVTPDGSDNCIALRDKLDQAARIITLACNLAGRAEAVGWADNVLDHLQDCPDCRFGWYEGEWSFAAPPELVVMLDGVSPAYRSYGPSLVDDEWTMSRDRMTSNIRKLDPMWMLRNASKIPTAAVDLLRAGSFERFRLLY